MFSPRGETLSESEKSQTEAAPFLPGHQPALPGDESCRRGHTEGGPVPGHSGSPRTMQKLRGSLCP